MTNYNDLWESTKAAEFQSSGFEKVPDGTYQAFVEKVTFKETQDPHQVSIQWRITGPKEAKRVVFANYKMHENGRSRLKRDIADMGLVVKKYSTIASELEFLIGKTGTLKLVTQEWQGKDFQNVWYEKVATTQAKNATAQSNVSTSHYDSDEIPF